MNTMIDTLQPVVANETTEQREPRKTSSVREHIVTWLIVVASVVAAIQLFRTVALQLEVNHALDQLYEAAGHATLPQS